MKTPLGIAGAKRGYLGRCATVAWSMFAGWSGLLARDLCGRVNPAGPAKLFSSLGRDSLGRGRGVRDLATYMTGPLRAPHWGVSRVRIPGPWSNEKYRINLTRKRRACRKNKRSPAKLGVRNVLLYGMSIRADCDCLHRGSESLTNGSSLLQVAREVNRRGPRWDSRQVPNWAASISIRPEDRET